MTNVNDDFKAYVITDNSPIYDQIAGTMAHEIGHNLGMHHDHDKRHRGKSCRGKGLMSYGKHPNKWSKCSKADFTGHYNKERRHWCLRRKSK